MANGKKRMDVLRGLRKSKIEDYLMVLAFAFYTADVIVMNITATTQTNLLPPGYLDTHQIGPKERDARHYGSVMTMVVEQCQISTIWLIKICVLLMWSNLTTVVYKWRHRIVVAIAFYVIFCWILMETLYFAVWCRPFSDYFAVPTPNPRQCAAAWNHLITNAVMNLSSDLMLLGITLSIAWEHNRNSLKDRNNLKFKTAFVALCGLGFFVLLCAVLNKAFSWTDPYSSQWTFWYIREASTAVLVSNLPYVWQLIARFRDRRVYNADGTLESTSRRSSVWRSTKEKPSQDHELSRLPSSAESSLQKFQREEYESDKPASAPNHIEDICSSSKNANREQRAEEKSLAQFRFDDRSRKFPSVDSTEMTFFDFATATAAGAQEPLPPPRVYAMPTPRNAPSVLPQRVGPEVLGWSSPAEWDTSAELQLSDVSGLADKGGAKKG